MLPEWPKLVAYRQSDKTFLFVTKDIANVGIVHSLDIDFTLQVARVEHANFRVLIWNLVYAPVEGQERELSEVEKAR